MYKNSLLPSKELIVKSIFKVYKELPKNGKPKCRGSNLFEWTILAGLCLCIPKLTNKVGVDDTRANEIEWNIECISLGTGLSCLPFQKLPLHGDVLHDSHSEIIARRGFLIYLYNQLELLLKGEESTFIERSYGSSNKFKLKEGVKLMMFVSTLPCGDASTYSLSLQSPSSSSTISKTEDSEHIPYSTTLLATSLGLDSSRSPSSTNSNSSPQTPESTTTIPQVRRGRANYNSFSSLRTKPGRIDSSPSISHSCSDKLALWSLVGIQGSLLSQFFEFLIKVDGLIIGGIEELGEEREKIKEEVRRAVGGRLEDWGNGRVRVPCIEFADEMFEDGRESAREVALKENGTVVSCLTSISYIKGNDLERHVIERGMKQGCPLKRIEGEAFAGKFRSRLSKLNLFERYQIVLGLSNNLEGVEHIRERLSYFDSKRSVASQEYNVLKTSVRAVGSPFEGWLISGKAFENFGVDGRLIE